MSRTFDELLWSIASSDGSPEAYKITKGLYPEGIDFILKNWDSTELKPNENSLGKLQRLIDMINSKETFVKGLGADGIANPADYLPATRIGDAYEKQITCEDIDGDGDVDKIEIDEES